LEFHKLFMPADQIFPIMDTVIGKQPWKKRASLVLWQTK